jgi:hypothetical protein
MKANEDRAHADLGRLDRHFARGSRRRQYLCPGATMEERSRRRPRRAQACSSRAATSWGSDPAGNQLADWPAGLSYRIRRAVHRSETSRSAGRCSPSSPWCPRSRPRPAGRRMARSLSSSAWLAWSHRPGHLHPRLAPPWRVTCATYPFLSHIALAETNAHGSTPRIELGVAPVPR